MERNKKELNSQSKSAFSTKDQTIPNFIQNSQFNSNNNNINSNNNSNKKSNNEIAKEVIKGLWGNGNERRRKLESEGYNYKEIQDEVNKILLHN